MGRLKKMFLLPIILLGLGTFLVANSVSAEVLEHTKPARATWLWHTAQIVNETDTLLDFMSSNGTTVVYLQANADIKNAAYENFIQKAAVLGIDVYALDGSSSWATAKGLKKQQKFFNWVTQYQQTTTENARFKGIHLDVEPYTLPSWRTNYNGTVLAYQQMLTIAEVEAAKLNLRLEADIPFWFDERFYDNQFGKGTLSEWIIDHTDGVTIMAYRDKVIGRNGIIALSQSELDYANTVGKKVTIGVETTYSDEGNGISFYEEGKAYMETQLVLVNQAFSQINSFNGFAIHSLAGWMALKD